MANVVLEKVEQVFKMYYTLDQTLAHLSQEMDALQKQVADMKTEIAELRLEELQQRASLDKRIALLEAGRETINAELRLSEERTGRIADRVEMMFRSHGQTPPQPAHPSLPDTGERQD
jgi:regulator of replication initiation timing